MGNSTMSNDRPTGVRWNIVMMLGAISATTYVDRLNMSIAGESIQIDLSFDTKTMGWILSAFVLGYAFFQVPGGWLGDRHGPKKVLTIALLWWSLFTGLTALASHLPTARWFGDAWSFAIIRFLIGLGEGAAFPNANKIVSLWTESSSRGLANGIFFTGLGIGGALTPVGVTWIMVHWGWQFSFYISAILGVLVAAMWHLYAKDRPEEHPFVNSAELVIIRSQSRCKVCEMQVVHQPTPWGRIFSNRSVWALFISYFLIGYPIYIYYTWFFIYLVRSRQLPLSHSALWTTTPFIAVMVLAPLGGIISDWAIARWGRRRGRQSAAWLGISLSGIMLMAGAHVTSNMWAIVLLACAAGFNLFAVPTWWATCIDLTPEFCGSLSGVMNMCGNIGGWLSPIITAYIVTKYGWSQALDFAALLTLAAGPLWLLINAGQSVESRLV